MSLAVSSAHAVANTAPSIWGKPAKFAQRDVLYVFTPQAADADRDQLRFSIVNKPRWMWFDARTGTLKGRPKWAQRSRTFSNIVIRVTDGQATRALPAFAITVSAKSGFSGNSAPVIDGAPPLKATVGEPYFFRPAASDANGDALKFFVLNKPRWAEFSPTTGTLRGTPAPGDERTFWNVTVRVSDGKAITSLQPFSITVSGPDENRSVTLSWIRPSRNTDGSALTDLAGYRIVYGTSPHNYTRSLPVGGALVQSAEVQGLTAGTWYFAIRSINQAGVESATSGEVRVTL